MGVHGLWKLIEPAGKPVPLESLENKVLAVDVSIWLYQLTKGLQTTGGGAIPNAHLLGLFNRICKLLYYRIKPVFVFDGGVPLLKKETIEARKRLKRKAQDDYDQLREKLLNNYLKQQAIRDYLGSEDVSTSSNFIDDMYALPPKPEDEERIDDPDSSDNEPEVTTAKLESFCNFQYGKDLHSIDIHSEQFKSLPADIRHEILSELVEMKKQNSWAKVNEMPEDSYDFSNFQLERLKKRRDVQRSLDSAAKEMGGRSMTLNELEAMFKEDGIVTDNLAGQRIVGDNVTRFVYVTGKSKEEKESAKDVQKPREKKDRVGIKEKQAEMEKIFEVSVPQKSSPINETKFEENIQKFDDIIFIKDSSSDEELDVVNETIDNDYIRSLLSKEKLSQEEIFEIIKKEQIDNESTSPSIITSDTDNKAAPYTMVVSAEIHEDKIIEPKLSEEEVFKGSNEEQNGNQSSSPSIITSDPDIRVASYAVAKFAEIHDDEIIEASQEFEKSKLSFLIDKSYQNTHAIVDAEKSTNNEIEPLPRENKVAESHSIELFLDDTGTDENLSDEFKRTDHLKEYIATQILPDRGDNCFEYKPVSVAQSSPAFSDTDSEDFIEVSFEEKSSYFKKDHKEIEISINPSKVIEDDLFSDVFDVQNLNETDTLERNPNDNVIFDKSLNDTVILNRNPLNDAEPWVHHEISDRVTVDESSQSASLHENVKNAEISEKTKPAEPIKSLNNILNKIKKSTKTIDEKITETKADLSSTDKRQNDEKFKEIQEILSKEQNELLAESGKKERLGSTITQQMIMEAQELLHLFGLPYVVAPMEAEAQCAFLDKISLTEGTITDDSDIWLFGGQKVYKNFFDQRKFVLQFRSVDIEHFFKLSREQLIQMALLVGSDYSVGIEGVGPVTALEILAYFSDSSTAPTSTDDIAETLRKFSVWLKNNRNETSRLSKKCKNVNLTKEFPNTTIIDAYLYPTVDESKEGFTWATPDLDRLRTYMNSKFGWKTSRIDEILLPVMKRMNEKNKQTTLDMFFKQRPFSTIEFGNVSKRVITAINVMKNKNDERPLPTPSTSKSPRKNLTKTPPKRTRKNVKKTPLKRTPTALPIHITSQNSSKKVAAPYFGETIPQRERDKMEAAKRKLDAIKVFQAQNKSNRNKNVKKKKVLPPKPDSSYLSESSSGDDI